MPVTYKKRVGLGGVNGKKLFIKDLLRSIEQSILDKVEKMPEEWDGHELRHYIAEKTRELSIWNEMSTPRRKEYENAVLTRYL